MLSNSSWKLDLGSLISFVTLDSDLTPLSLNLLLCKGGQSLSRCEKELAACRRFPEYEGEVS